MSDRLRAARALTSPAVQLEDFFRGEEALDFPAASSGCFVVVTIIIISFKRSAAIRNAPGPRAGEVTCTAAVRVTHVNESTWKYQTYVVGMHR